MVHIGDLLMFDEDGKINIPYIATGGGFKKYIETLETLKTIPCNTVLIPHSNNPITREKMLEAIDNYTFYLKKVLNSKGNLPFNICLKENISAYAHPEFHDTNLIQLMMES